MSRRGPALAALLVTLAASPGLADDVHVVQPGESLWQIAAALSGNPKRWRELYRANRDQIKDPSLLYPGQRLSIPEGVREHAGDTPSSASSASSGRESRK